MYIDNQGAFYKDHFGRDIALTSASRGQAFYYNYRDLKKALKITEFGKVVINLGLEEVEVGETTEGLGYFYSTIGDSRLRGSGKQIFLGSADMSMFQERELVEARSRSAINDRRATGNARHDILQHRKGMLIHVDL